MSEVTLFRQWSLLAASPAAETEAESTGHHKLSSSAPAEADQP